MPVDRAAHLRSLIPFSTDPAWLEREARVASSDTDSVLDKVAEAIERAQCPDREGPYGLYSYGKYAVRDFRDYSSPDYGKVIFTHEDENIARAEYEKLTRRHIARAGIKAFLGESHDF